MLAAIARIVYSFCKPFLLTEAFSAKLRMIVFSSVSYEAHIYYTSFEEF